MNYKNIILSLTFLAGFGLIFVAPVLPVKAAACGGVLECQIAAILEQIRALQAQLAVLQSQQGQTQPWCYTFNSNFGIGASNADFGALVTVLDKENISEFTSFNRPSQYNEVVAAAVVRLQAKHGILQTGYIGPITRARLNALYGCSVVTSVQPSVKVLSPNGGETYVSNSSMNVTWTTTGIMPLETIDLIRLRSYTTGQEYNLAYATMNDGQENVVMPSFVPAGSYLLEIKTYKNNVLVFDASDSYFKIVNVGVQPTIMVTSPNGYKACQIGQLCNIAWSASGVQNNVNIFLVRYINGTLSQEIIANVPASQGSYLWRIGDFNPAGQSFKILIVGYTAPVVSAYSDYFTINDTVSVQPSVTVTSPNGGEQLVAGQTYPIQIACNEGVSKVLNISLVDYRAGPVFTALFSGVTCRSGATSSYSWTVPASYQPANGAFKIQVATYDSSLVDYSDNYFSIIAPGDTFIPWLQAKSYIENCNVKTVMQLHNLTVYLTLWNNTRVATVEPSIDEVIRVTQGVSYRCGNIPIATE